MLISVIGWVLFGLGAGAVARRLRGGPNAIGWAAAGLLGVVGALLGGGFAHMIGYGTSPIQAAGWLMSILGAIIVLSAASLRDLARRSL